MRRMHKAKNGVEDARRKWYNTRPMNPVYLVAGIDTGIGKTVATGLMAKFLRARGADAITVKLVQTGNDGFSEDIEAHRRICGCGQLSEDKAGLTAPQIFKFPSSPKLAAELEGRTVDLGRIGKCVEECAKRRSPVLVEAAGGLHVPLADDVLTIDFAAERKWPVVLVTCGRLGSINHTLLALEAIRSRGMALAGVVYNWHQDADPTIDRDTPETVLSYLGKWGFPRRLVRVPRVPDGGPYPDVDFSEIFA